MKSTKDLNNVSKETLKNLGLDDTLNVTIILSGLTYENGIAQAPAALALPSEDRILDATTGEYVSIANVSGFQPNGQPLIKDIQIFGTEGGMRTYNTRSVAQREELEYLLLSNYNGSNPNRDESKSIMFTVSNPAAEKKVQLASQLLLGKAITKVGTMTDAEIKTYALARGIELSTDIDVTRGEIVGIAMRDPGVFIASIDPEYQHIVATIRKAEYDGVLSFNPSTNTWTWAGSGDAIVTLPRSAKFDRYDAFKAWLDTSDDAHVVFENIEKTVGTTAPGKNKKATPAAPKKAVETTEGTEKTEGTE